jgi:predicted pyridoxine 5'-phosphate oxidase superfamily flavin-nucleotide-binding protein
MTHEQAIETLMEHSKEDFLQMHKLIAYAARDTGRIEDFDEWDCGPGVPEHPHLITDPAEVKAKTLELIRDLLNTRQLMAGDWPYGAQRVEPWRIPVAAAVQRVDQLWTALGKEPNLGEPPIALESCAPENWPHGA